MREKYAIILATAVRRRRFIFLGDRKIFIMKILAIGDIVGNKCVDYLADRLFLVKQELGADMVVANGENASDIHGISAKNATDILSAGVDVITLGNHTFA